MATLDLSTTSQSTIFFEDLKMKASEKIVNFSKQHTNIARFTGLPIGLCFSLLNLAKAVSNIGETLIKGLANIFGSPFSEQCKFSKGVKQIFLQLPGHIIHSALQLPLETVFEVLTIPGMFILPVSTAELRKYEANSKKQALQSLADRTSYNLPKNEPIKKIFIKLTSLILKHLYF